MASNTLLALLSVINIYVSPTGNNTNDGMSPSQPVQTLEQAQTLERSNSPSTNSVTVNVMAGTYTLTKTLIFDYRDSGATWQAYNNGPAEISGGTSLASSWTLSGGVYQASYSGNLFRQLYVNGARAMRARSAESYIVEIGYNRINDVNGVPVPVAIAVNTADVPNISGLNTANAPEIHFGLDGVGFNIARIASIQQRDSTTSWVVPMAAEADLMKKINWYAGPETRQAFFFENAKELLDQPGEWFFDSAASSIYYKPRAGESMSTATVIRPTLGDNGPLFTISDATNLTIKGLTFEYTTWTEPSYQGLISNEGGRIYEPSVYPNPNWSGYSWPNAEVPFGAVVISGWDETHLATNITFLRNTFKHRGGSGLDIWKFANNISFVGNVFQDISANGITINNPGYGTAPGDLADPHHITVRNNFITTVGQDYQGSVGIYANYPNTLTIYHNEIYNVPGAGMFLEGGLTSAQTSSQNNDIQYNKINNVLRKRWDAGGIYINSFQGGTGTIIANNSITNIVGNLNEQVWAGSAADDPGIYLDKGVDYVTVQNNYIKNVPLVPPSLVNPGQPTPWGPNNVFGSVGPHGTIGINGSGVQVSGAGLESAYLGLRPAPAPAAPSGLKATARGDGTVAMEWKDNSSNEDGFDVERWDAVAHNWARVATLGKDSTTYNDTRLQSGVAYYYRVKAISAGDVSKYSNTVSILAPYTSFIDTTTAGNWKTQYGAQGYYILGDTSGPNPTYPSYAQVNLLRGNLAAPWAYPGDTDTRGLQQIAGTHRTLSTWWDGNTQGLGSIVLDINLTDGLTHQVALYSVNFYSGAPYYQNRNETVTVKDAATGLVLDSRVIPIGSVFDNGVYVGFNVSGHVRFEVTSTDGSQVVHGLFFDAYVPHLVASVSSLGTLHNDYTGYVGMKFTTGANTVPVTQLGRWVVSGNSQSHPIKLVNASTGALVAITVVNTAGATPGAFAYGRLSSPVTLAANTAYYLVSQETSGGDRWYDYASTVASTGLVASIDSGVWWNGTSWNLAGGTNHTYVPVDLIGSQP